MRLCNIERQASYYSQQLSRAVGICKGPCACVTFTLSMCSNIYMRSVRRM